MTKKEQIYARVDEQNVKTLVLYANTSGALYYDEAANKDKVLKADLTDLFLKGITVVKAGIYYKPVCLKSTGLVASDGTSTAVTFTAS